MSSAIKKSKDLMIEIIEDIQFVDGNVYNEKQLIEKYNITEEFLNLIVDKLLDVYIEIEEKFR